MDGAECTYEFTKERKRESVRPIKRKEVINFRERSSIWKRLWEEKERRNDVIIDLWPPRGHIWTAAFIYY